MGTQKNDILQGTLTLLVLRTLASNKRMQRDRNPADCYNIRRIDPGNRAAST
jgi:hypothetical protein